MYKKQLLYFEGWMYIFTSRFNKKRDNQCVVIALYTAAGEKIKRNFSLDLYLH